MPRTLAKKEGTFSRRGSWVKNPLFILILFFLLVFLSVRYFSTAPEKTFGLKKKGDKLIISGLEEEDIQEKIDWREQALWTPEFGNRIQICLKGKESNWLRKIFQKPTLYYTTISSLEEGDDLRDKEIEFVGFPEIKDKKIRKAKYTLVERHNMFREKGWDFDRFIWWVFMVVVILTALISIDFYFGTNFAGWLAYPFTSWKRDEDEMHVPGTTFKEVGGLAEAKEELGEVVAYFRNPALFWQRGAKVPKGVLLVGPPGNGKTLLAKALAGECGLPFLFRSGSEFEEMMVGVGARRVRQLFDKARNYPQGCIIFIDEIDSIGRKRYGSHANYTEQTLNQLLNELDGFQPRTNIIILAATNSLKVLDAALLRPGRFDRQIYIPPPNLKGRKEIITLCTKRLSLAPNFNLAEIASLTRGFSGAQITNLFNEASILSIRHQRNFIDQEIILEAYDRVLMGPSLISETVTAEQKRITAYHEAGHAVIGMTLPETTVWKITITPRLGIGGYTWIDLTEEESDINKWSKNQMLARVMTALGGRASEELILGSEKVTAGAWSDFRTAIEIVRDLILHFGMSDLGIIPTRETFFSDWEIPAELPEISKQKIEQEREKIMSQCWKSVRRILSQKRRVLDLLAAALITKNTLYKEEINYIFYTQVAPGTFQLSASLN
ncbi:MAG: AAA family ATPase [Candidatus Moeniiplasma glomeromycotorum]|nr:AAA family ATPase [Candidatus Moeniiplasma glomeromycotorum]MCE8167333.1 AAA family ATPase [Candidatus Moeniiplasma glomeromycotorum]MCE8168654.1 AAA family ATPase [Candidatus Moeniiplasma glomeromycotorum]